MRNKLLVLLFLMLSLCPDLAYSQDTGSIFDTRAKRIGYYWKQGNRVEIFDTSWERKGYIILNDKSKDYFNPGHERINPDKLFREIEK